MFFFFAGGVTQQVRHVINPSVGWCIACNSRADLVEYEKVLKLFVVPVWRWPGKQPIMHCNGCGLFYPPMLPKEELSGVGRCESCFKEVDSEFKFCPFCGYKL